MPYDHKARTAAVQAAREAGYEAMLDVIQIQKGKRFENLRVQSSEPPYMHLLVKKETRDGVVVRVDVFNADAEKTLECSLVSLEEDVSRQMHTRGVFQTVYKGVVAVGKDKGKEQTWALVYYP